MVRRGQGKAQVYQKRYADGQRRAVSCKKGQTAWLKATNPRTDANSKDLEDRFKGPVILRVTGENGALLSSVASFLVKSVSHVSLLTPAQEEPSHVKIRPWCKAEQGKKNT